MINYIKRLLAARERRKRQDKALLAIVAALQAEHEAMCQQIAWAIVMKQQREKLEREQGDE